MKILILTLVLIGIVVAFPQGGADDFDTNADYANPQTYNDDYQDGEVSRSGFDIPFSASPVQQTNNNDYQDSDLSKNDDGSEPSFSDTPAQQTNDYDYRDVSNINDSEDPLGQSLPPAKSKLLPSKDRTSSNIVEDSEVPNFVQSFAINQREGVPGDEQIDLSEILGDHFPSNIVTALQDEIYQKTSGSK